MTTGSGSIAQETRPLAEWSSVNLACPGRLEIETGPNQGIAIEADDNILPLIETLVDDGRLTIRFKPSLGSIRPVTSIMFRAATPAIDAMTVPGTGSIHSGPIARPEPCVVRPRSRRSGSAAPATSTRAIWRASAPRSRSPAPVQRWCGSSSRLRGGSAVAVRSSTPVNHRHRSARPARAGSSRCRPERLSSARRTGEWCGVVSAESTARSPSVAS